MNKQPVTITINLIVMLLNALIWLVLGLIIILDLHPSLSVAAGMRIGLAIISIVLSGILFGLAYFLRKHSRTAYYLTLAFFALTTVLIIFDQIGAADIAFLVISIVPIILLIIDRKWYLQVN